MRELTDQGAACQQCRATELELVCVIERQGVPHGQWGHDATYSRVTGSRCPACGTEHIEKTQHDCFNKDDVWEQSHTYRLHSGGTLRTVLADCPNPLSAECPCATHAALRAASRSLPRPSKASVGAISLERREGGDIVISAEAVRDTN